MQCGGAVAVQCIGEAGQRHGGSGFGVNGMKDCVFRLECQPAGGRLQEGQNGDEAPRRASFH